MTVGKFAVVGVAAGTVGGLFGVGGGIVMVPVLVLFFSFAQHMAQGTSLAAMIPLAIAGMLRYHFKGNVDWPTATGLAIGCVIGVTFIGAPNAHLITDTVLRQMFGAFMILAGLRMLGFFKLIGAALGIGQG